MRNINLSALHTSLLKYHDFFHFTLLFCLCFVFIGCNAQGACHSANSIHHSRLCESRNSYCLRLQWPNYFTFLFDAIFCLLAASILKRRVMEFSAAANTFFFSRRRRRRRCHIVIVSLSPLVVFHWQCSCRMLNEMAWPKTKQQVSKSIRFAKTLSFNSNIKYNKYQRTTFLTGLSLLSQFGTSSSLVICAHRTPHTFAHMRQTIRYHISHKMLISDNMTLPHCCR